MMRVAVVYIDRHGNDPRFARHFLASLFRNEPGANFELIWQAKNYPAGRNSPELERVRADLSLPFSIVHYPDSAYQFTLALDAARNFDCELLLFFTSWSRIVAPFWLRHYLDTFDKVASCGVVGATGSYELMSETPEFPNVHIRTNAFMIPRKTLLDLHFGPLQSIYDGNLVEAGPNGLTRQIGAMGLRPVVVDREGCYYLQEDWPTSRTFRSGRQERLLVADNRTFDFAVAKRDARIYLAQLAWRERAVLEFPSVIERMITRYAWHRRIRPGSSISA